jgi:DNA invertase Pin-like site-specific DNA recombinase
MRRRIAFYLRVSTAGQTVENQHRELKVVAARHGWQVVAIFKDEGISGTKGRDKRPGYNQLCQRIARREFDQVAAWSVDRLGRSLQDLVVFLGELRSKGIDLYLHQQGCCQSNANSSPEVARFVNIMRVYTASIRHSAWAAERPCL